MKLIPLTQGKFAQVDDSDFEWLNQWKWYAQKNRSGIYYAARVSSKLYPPRKIIKMHRFVLGVTNSEILVDHADHNGLNNQRNNLRVATRSQNLANRRSSKNSASKYLGVSCWMGKWKAQIKKDGKSYLLGSFNNEVDAAIAYNNKATELHGEFANLNIIQ